MCETTALGAAIAAGRAEGIRKWDVRSNMAVPSDTFFPSITDNGNLNILSSIFSLVFLNRTEHLKNIVMWVTHKKINLKNEIILGWSLFELQLGIF